MFFNAFEEDLFEARRDGTYAAGNPWDPDSLLTGAEIEAGMTYSNSSRDFPDKATYLKAVAGQIDVDTILEIAPRRTHEKSTGLSPMMRLADRGFNLQGPFGSLPV